MQESANSEARWLQKILGSVKKAASGAAEVANMVQEVATLLKQHQVGRGLRPGCQRMAFRCSLRCLGRLHEWNTAAVSMGAC